MSQTIPQILQHGLAFPDVELALKDPNGLLAIGGDLSAERLLAAYQQGIFPWYNEGSPILWWAPDPRTIIYTHQVKINRTLHKFIKKSPYRVTLNNDFKQVISKCSNAPYRKDGTWIVDAMQQAYYRLHQMGHAHSIEVWFADQLVGGLYGVAINGLFCGESMFYQRANASKIALISLAKALGRVNVDIIDCQFSNVFLQTMGCVDIKRMQYSMLKSKALATIMPQNFWQPRELK